MNLRFSVAYLGSSFSGFQYQTNPDAPGVANFIVDALTTVLALTEEDKGKLRLACAGRTDAGVHATGQIVNVHVPLPIMTKRLKLAPSAALPAEYLPLLDYPPPVEDPGYNLRSEANRLPDDIVLTKFRELNVKLKDELAKLAYSLNALLPDGVKLSRPAVYPNNFHSRFSCKGRSYRYTIYNAAVPHPLVQGRAMWYRYPLDVKAMAEACKPLMGEHDFAAYTKALYAEDRTVRRLDAVTVTRDRFAVSGDLIHVQIDGSGFLHNMIRILIGGLILVGHGKEDTGYLKRLLDSRDRTLGPATAVPDGLCFWSAVYNWPDLHVPEFEL